MYEITYKRQAANYLRKLTQKQSRAIRDDIENLAKTGTHPKAKQLAGRDGYRLVVGSYRIIYNRYDDELVVEIIKVRPRGDVYK